MLYRPLPTRAALIAAATLACLSPAAHAATRVEVTTPLGKIVWEMKPGAAPETVWNFLRYVGDGDYTDSFIHRSAAVTVEDPENPGTFIAEPGAIQGGGFTFTESGIGLVPTDDPVVNEPGVSNLRGTVAMARSSAVNSATNQWYINMRDNDGSPWFLDTQNEGFTVFAEVVSGMDVADAIAALQVVDATNGNAASPFGEIPVLDSYVPNEVNFDEVVKTSFRVIGDTDGDGDIDNSDLQRTIAGFTGPTGSGATFATGDTDGDGDVDNSDLQAMIGGFTGPMPPLAAAVPEPASIALLALGGALIGRRRR